ncbi:monovalent cation/H+ antiporter complex subunit F [Gordonia aurantiaca]|uniref:monovalent cation/H+ antiporter complex subunit F n=1 Tax=Gordonia sp. B21 TaxID=3151852 RepID=UPI003263C186
MSVVWTIATAVLLIAAILTMATALRGPSTLDRLVALDVLIALCMCGLGVWAAYSRDSTVVPSIVALALLSFVGSVSIARFRVRDDQK